MKSTCGYKSPFDGWTCPETDLSGRGYCIFHDSDLAKDAGRLQQRMDERITQPDPPGALRFDGAVFPDGVTFEGREFKSGASFRGAHFFGTVTSFSGATFGGKGPTATSFEGAVFQGNLVSFQGARFRGETVSFADTHWLCRIVTFQNAEFSAGRTFFTGARFLWEEVSFRNARFFGKETSFVEAGFSGDETLFLNTVFRAEETSFRNTRFSGKQVSFRGSLFDGLTTSFGGAEFAGRIALFRNARFLGHETRFFGCRFSGYLADFRGARFGRKTVFEGESPGGVFLGKEADFRDVAFEPLPEGQEIPKPRLVFDWVDVSRVRFLRSDLSQIGFRQTEWASPPNWNLGIFRWGRWRKGLYDEICWRAERNDPKNGKKEVDALHLCHLERNYSQLERSHRESGEPKLSGHFHYGRMEARWHQPGRKLRKIGDWHRRWLSGYGWDYRLAAVVLLLMFLGFGAGFRLLDIPKFDDTLPRSVKWRESVLYSFQVGYPWWADLNKARFWLPQLPKMPRDPGPWPRKPRYPTEDTDPDPLVFRRFTEELVLNPTVGYFHVLQLLLISLQTGYLFVALRNRFLR